MVRQIASFDERPLVEMRKHDADWPIAIIAGKPLLFRLEPLLILGAGHRPLTFGTEPLVRP